MIPFRNMYLSYDLITCDMCAETLKPRIWIWLVLKVLLRFRYDNGYDMQPYEHLNLFVSRFGVELKYSDSFAHWNANAMGCFDGILILITFILVSQIKFRSLTIHGIHWKMESMSCSHSINIICTCCIMYRSSNQIHYQVNILYVFIHCGSEWIVKWPIFNMWMFDISIVYFECDIIIIKCICCQ